MNLFALDKSEMNEVFEHLNVDNIAFVMESRDNMYMSCTCGFCDNLALRRWKYGLGRTGSNEDYSCPSCGTKTVYTIDDEEVSFVIRYVSEVLTDSEDILDVKIRQLLGERDATYFDCFIDDNAILVRYFKKERRFAFYGMERSDKIEDIEYFEEKEKLNDFFGYCSEFNTDYYGLPQSNDTAGFKELSDIFRPYIPNIKVWEPREEIDLISFLVDIYMSNESQLYSFIRDAQIDEGKWKLLKYGKFELSAGDLPAAKANIQFLVDNGIDKDASSLEEATGFTTEQLLTTDGYRDLVNTKKFYGNVEKYGLTSYLEELEIVFDSKERIWFLQLFEKSCCENFGDFLKFVCRGVKSENLEVKEVLNKMQSMIEKSDNEDIAKLLNYKKAFSLNLYKRFMLIRDEVISYDMLDKLQKKPTLDTLAKLLCSVAVSD